MTCGDCERADCVSRKMPDDEGKILLIGRVEFET